MNTAANPAAGFSGRHHPLAGNGFEVYRTPGKLVAVSG